MRFCFEKLEIWHEARAINWIIYALAREFQKHEAFALTSQIRRVAVSISANIAKGAGRN